MRKTQTFNAKNSLYMLWVWNNLIKLYLLSIENYKARGRVRDFGFGRVNKDRIIYIECFRKLARVQMM